MAAPYIASACPFCPGLIGVDLDRYRAEHPSATNADVVALMDSYRDSHLRWHAEQLVEEVEANGTER